jgi:hypothetical protein
MSSYLRLDRFVESANQTLFLPKQNKFLVADPNGIGVESKEIPRSFSPEMIEQNKKTWKAYRESLIETIGQRKFDWICCRYRSRLNFTSLEKSGKPLLPEHVELFSIGSSQLTGRDIKYRFPEKLRTSTREQLHDRIRLVQPFPIVGNYRDPIKIAGNPGSFFACFFHNKILMDKEKQLLFSDAEHLSSHAWIERFSKVTINREFIEGQLFPAQGSDGRIDYYKVHRKITSGDGLIAYALRPAASDSTLKPLIAFRPTQWALSNEDAIESYLNDVQTNIGEMGWNTTKHLFDQLMRDPKFRRPDEKISIAGYSLGGAHAQRFLEFHYENVSQAFFYSDPSVEDATAERIRTKINAMPRRNEPLNIQIVRMKGDFCHYVGGKHAGWGVTHPDVNIQLMEIDHENKQISTLYLHSYRIFDNTLFSYQMQCHENPNELLKHLDNSERGPDVFWYERMRRIWGKAAFYSFYGLSKLIKLISNIFGVRVLRSSREPDF